MPKYHQFDNWDVNTNAPSSNFIYDFEVYRFIVRDDWREVYGHNDDGSAVSGSFDAFKGTVGRIHLDYLSRASRRRFSIIAEKGNLEYDFITGMLEIYEAGSEFWKRRLCNEDRNMMYKRQLKHFMECVKNKSKPLVDAADSIKTLEFALKIRNGSKG